MGGICCTTCKECSKCFWTPFCACSTLNNIEPCSIICCPVQTFCPCGCCFEQGGCFEPCKSDVCLPDCGNCRGGRICWGDDCCMSCDGTTPQKCCGSDCTDWAWAAQKAQAEALKVGQLAQDQVGQVAQFSSTGLPGKILP